MIPSIGRLVRYVLNSGPSAGQIRPALIVRVWDEKPTEQSRVQLQVFTDDFNDQAPQLLRRDEVVQDAKNKTAGTWHAPEREGAGVSQEEADLALLIRLEAAAQRRDEARKAAHKNRQQQEPAAPATPNATAAKTATPDASTEQKPA